ncbi:unnamed protein product, partial [Rotaria sp. Silwood2]
STTTVLPPTTTTMNYCTEEKGMNQPLDIQPNQVKSYPLPEQPTSGDINPTSTTPGFNYPTINPQINVTLDQPASLTLIYLPVDRPNHPSNVETFVVQFVYPNGTKSEEFPSNIPSISATTTTTPSGMSTEKTPTTSVIVPPSNKSPQVDLSPNVELPINTIIMITIIST